MYDTSSYVLSPPRLTFRDTLFVINARLAFRRVFSVTHLARLRAVLFFFPSFLPLQNDFFVMFERYSHPFPEKRFGFPTP